MLLCHKLPLQAAIACHLTYCLICLIQSYRKLPSITGKDSQGAKGREIKSKLVKCKGIEAKYLVRGLLKGKLRIGVAKMTVLVALAHAFATLPEQVCAPFRHGPVLHVSSSGMRSPASRVNDVLLCTFFCSLARD